MQEDNEFWAAVHPWVSVQNIYVTPAWCTELTPPQRAIVLLHELSHINNANEQTAWDLVYEGELRYRALTNGLPLPLPPSQPNIVLFDESRYNAVNDYLPLARRIGMTASMNLGVLEHYSFPTQ